ncbi:hypothetical protein [Engelhardtia mirabilis]|uniref:Uncharacterized protein n=1 Tax=Engelhardtia mirabilis TaxID=2528011 RepID=A0A518BRE4_9BACT|nr:hypothetical protein Pla133_46650 [Planctomycetes bacterium Pla133]QDV03871.1 hypothetical protein Pla86_46630 [Planctomycetes bacterium Pla86]
MPSRTSLPAKSAALAGLGLTLATLTSGCQSTSTASADNTVDPILEQEFGQLEIGVAGVELGVGLASTTDFGTVQSRFTARSIDGGATRVLGLALEFWIDANSDGVLNDGERATLMERREPNGTDVLTIPFEVPYEKGRPLRFVATVDTTVGSKTIPGDFALP